MLSLLQAGCQAELTLTINLGGDVILGRDGQAIFTEDPWGTLAQDQSAVDGSRNWFLVNLESPLGNTSETEIFDGEGYNLCAPAESAEILKMGGVDVISVANNHKDDCAEQADPFELSEGIPVVCESQPVFLESAAGTVAVIAVDAVSKPLELASLLESVAELKAESDAVIVSLHWGVEYAGEPTLLQREQARQLANAGVDVLWGHHPHVLQPAEWIDSEDGSQRMLALYSLGNLLTDQTMTNETRHSALIQLQFVGGEISQLSFQPVVLTRINGELMLACPSKEEISQISERLGWAELVASFP